MLSGRKSGSARPAGMLDRMRAKFPTAAIAVFSCAGSWDGLGLSGECARLTGGG
jgi:hypothetical protein